VLRSDDSGLLEERQKALIAGEQVDEPLRVVTKVQCVGKIQGQMAAEELELEFICQVQTALNIHYNR
jgi:hypothetical protein